MAKLTGDNLTIWNCQIAEFRRPPTGDERWAEHQAYQSWYWANQWKLPQSAGYVQRFRWLWIHYGLIDDQGNPTPEGIASKDENPTPPSTEKRRW